MDAYAEVDINQLNNQDQRKLIMHLQHQASKTATQNNNLLKKLKHLNHTMEIADQKIRLKIEQLVTKEQFISKRKQDILKITRERVRNEELVAKYTQKYSKLEKQVLKLCQNVERDRRQIQQQEIAVKRIQRQIKSISEQCTHGFQELQLRQTKADTLQKLQQSKHKTQGKIQQFMFQIEEIQCKRQGDQAILSNESKRIANMSNLISKKAKNNAALKERLRIVKLDQGRFLYNGELKIKNLKKDQKQQIKHLQLQIGRLNQQLLFANQKEMDLKNAIAEKARGNKEIEYMIRSLREGNTEGLSMQSSILQQKSERYARKERNEKEERDSEPHQLLQSMTITMPAYFSSQNYYKDPSLQSQSGLSAQKFEASLKLTKSLQKKKTPKLQEKNSQESQAKSRNNNSKGERQRQSVPKQQNSSRIENKKKVQYQYHIIESQDEQEKQETTTVPKTKNYKTKGRINTRTFNDNERVEPIKIFQNYNQKQHQRKHEYESNQNYNSNQEQFYEENNRKIQEKQNSKRGSVSSAKKGWRQNGDLKRLIERYQFIKSHSKVVS